MNTIIARFKVKEGKEAEAEKKLGEMVAAVKANEPGALVYILHKNQEDPSEFIFFEVYKDDEAFASHAKTDHMAKMRENFAALADPSTMKIERLERVAGVVRAG